MKNIILYFLTWILTFGQYWVSCFPISFPVTTVRFLTTAFQTCHETETYMYNIFSEGRQLQYCGHTRKGDSGVITHEIKEIDSDMVPLPWGGGERERKRQKHTPLPWIWAKKLGVGVARRNPALLIRKNSPSLFQSLQKQSKGEEIRERIEHLLDNDIKSPSGTMQMHSNISYM